MKTLRVRYRLHSGKKVEITGTQNVAKTIARALYPDSVPDRREDEERANRSQRAKVHPPESKIEFLLPETNKRGQVIVQGTDAELVWDKLHRAGWRMLHLERTRPSGV